jgi:hypothetical protein
MQLVQAVVGILCEALVGINVMAASVGRGFDLRPVDLCEGGSPSTWQEFAATAASMLQLRWLFI